MKKKERETQKKKPVRAEDSFWSSNENLPTLIHSTALAIIVMDTKAVVRMWSPSAERMFGWSAEEVIGKPLPIIPDDERKAFLRQMKEGGRGKVFTNMHKRRKRKDGTLIDVSISSSIVRDADGNVAGFMGIVDDISDQKQMESALIKSEQNFRMVVDTMMEGLCILDKNIVISYANDTFCSMLKYSREEIIGKSPFDIIDEESKKIFTKELEKRKKGEPSTYELAFVRKDGEKVFVILSATPILDDERRFEGTFAVFTDVTERKQTEGALKKVYDELEVRVKERTAELSMANTVLVRQIAERHKAQEEIQKAKVYQEALLENSLVAIFTIKKNGTIGYINPRAEELSGYKKEDLYGKNFMQFIPEHRKDYILQKWKEINYAGVPERYITEIIKADGTLMHCFISHSVMEGFDEFLVSLQDITENIKAEEALRESENRLRAIIDMEPACVKVVREDGTILEMNAAGLAILEAEFTDDVIGKCIYDVITQEHKEAFRMLNESVCRGNSGSLEFELISLRGNRRWMETHAVPIRYGDSKGKSAALAITYDITERRKSENALRESESRYRALSETNPVGIWQITREGYTIYINPTMCSMIEIESPQELEGKTYHEFVTPESNKKIETEQMNRNKGLATSYEIEIIGKHGNKRNVIISGAPVFSADGQFHSSMGTFIDITERKQQEEKLASTLSLLSATLDSTGDGILVVNTEGKIASFNKEFLAMWRIPDSVIETRDDEQALAFVLCQLEDPEAFLKKVRELYATPEDNSYDELFFKDGRVFERYSQPQIIEDEIVGRVWCFRDMTERRYMYEALKQKEEQYRLLFEGNPHPMWIFDIETLSFLAVNDSAVHHYGYTREEFLSMTVKNIRPREDVPILLKHLEVSVLPGIDFEGTRRHVKKDGTVIDTEITSHEIMFAGRRAKMVMAMDVTERKYVQETLQDNESRLRMLTEKMPAVLWTTDIDLRVTSFLGAGLEGLQSKPGQAVGMTLYEYFQTNDKDFTTISAHLRALQGETVSYELVWMGRTLHSHVESLHDIGGRIIGCINVALDITERHLAEETVQHQAYHDSLTGLPNKMLFNERLAINLAHAHRRGEMLAVLFLDLDRFKTINDTLGHAVGDQLLQGVAGRLISHMEEDYTIARLGGDGFMILIPEVKHVDEVARTAQNILDAFKQPWSVNGHELFITTSIGIALYPNDGDDVETLVRNADTAVYRAKEQGRNNYQLYASSMNVKAFEQLVMENSLRRALDRKEFIVYYQPQVDIHNGQIVGIEALIRWQHTDLGLIFPSNFIPIAEETGMIVPIGEWVLKTACEQNKAWQKAGHTPIRVSVNLASRQFQQKDLVDSVSRILHETKLEPQYLDLELTESVVMENADITLLVLRELTKKGIHISIDDFGTGYSSLSYLKKFPIYTLKIDQSFVRDITTDPNDAAIASAIIVLGHSLKLKVVAEGVETKEQLAFLKLQKCDQIQGFLFSHPLPAKDFEKLLAKKYILPA